jgi:hypothetical protein
VTYAIVPWMMMSVRFASQPPLVRRGEMPVAAHGWSAPVSGLTDAMPSWATLLTVVFSPPNSSRELSGEIAVSVTRPTVFAVNAVTTSPLVVFRRAMRVRLTPLTVPKSPPM